MYKKKIYASFVPIIIVTFFYFTKKEKTWNQIQLSGLHTWVSIQAYADNKDFQKISQKTQKLVYLQDSILSEENPNNPLFKLSHSPKKTKVIANPSQKKLIEYVLIQNQTYFQQTTKLSPFQLGIGEFLHLYNLQEKSDNIVPKEKIKFLQKKISTLLKKGSYYQIKGDTIISGKDSLRLTLGGLSKGFSLEEIKQIFEKHNIKHYFINAGGDLITKGLNKHKKPWSIGIQNPRKHQGIYFGIVKMKSPIFKSLATSGSYLKKNNTLKVHHLINPFTGSSIKDKVSISVLAPDALTADFYATFLFLLPTKGAIEYAEYLNLPTMIIDSSYQIKQTKNFSSFFTLVESI